MYNLNYPNTIINPLHCDWYKNQNRLKKRYSSTFRTKRQKHNHHHHRTFVSSVVVLGFVSISLLILFVVPSQQKQQLNVNAFQPKLFITTISATFGKRIHWDSSNRQQQQQQQYNINTMNVPSNKGKSSTTKIHDEAAVLRELKEIIQRQAKEIDELKRKQVVVGATATAATSAHGAHGGGGDISPDELSKYLHKPFYEIATKRVVWLSIFLCSLSLTAVIMSGFEHTLSKQIELAYFVPLLAGHGGNTGGQTVGTVLSALSSGSITKNDAPAVIGKEALSGLTAGTILGFIVCVIAHYIMGISMPVSTVVLCTIPLVSTIAATLGAAIPFVCLWAGLDPSVIAAPAMTSFVDVSGLMSYFLIANQIFHMFGIEL